MPSRFGRRGVGAFSSSVGGVPSHAGAPPTDFVFGAAPQEPAVIPRPVYESTYLTGEFSSPVR